MLGIWMSSHWKSTTHLRHILNRCARSASPDERPTNCAHPQIDLGNSTSPNRSNDVSSRSRSGRNGGSDESHLDANLPSEDDRNSQQEAEAFISTLAASNQPINL